VAIHLPGGFLRNVAVILAGWALLQSQSPAASVFEALGLTPEQLARADTWADSSALANLPASEAERGRLISALLESEPSETRAVRVRYAASLLELWGQRGRALAILENEPSGDFDTVQIMRLRFREGKLDAAKETFAAMQSIPIPIGPVWVFPEHRIQGAVTPFIVEERLDEMAAFLAWLQPQCRISEWRSAVLAQRLNLALHRGNLDSLLAELAKESGLTRSIADRFLDPDNPVEIPAVGLPVPDLAWLVKIEGCTDQAAPFLGEAIRSGAGNEADRRELFRQILRKYNENEPRRRLLLDWIGREEEFIRLFTGIPPVISFSTNLPSEALCELAGRHPGNAYLNFLAGANQTSRLGRNQYDPGIVTRAGLDCLERAFVSSSLPIRHPSPEPSLKDLARGKISYPIWKEDPAFFALKQLSDHFSSRKLHDLLFSRADFRALPLPDRLRYLNAAGLDLPVVDIIFQTNWRDPANDAYGGSVALPSAGLREPPQDVVDRFNVLLPEILLGSPEKPAALVAAHSRRPLEILFKPAGIRQSPWELDLLRRWHAGLVARGPEFTRQVLEAGQWIRGAELDLGLLVEILGKEAAEREVKHRAAAAAAELAAKLRACSWFRPDGLSGFPAGYGPDDGFQHPIFLGPSWMESDHEGLGPVGWLVPRYPALAYLTEERGSLQPSAVPWAATLRAHLPATSELAAAFDIAITTKLLKAPDPATAARAEAHVGAMLKSREDSDFILFRACNGVWRQNYHQPPADPGAIEELAKLADAPLPVRRAAADLARRADGERSKRLLAVLRCEELATRGASRGHSDPNPPSAPSLPRMIEALREKTDLDALCALMEEFSDSGQMGTFAVARIPDVMDRFKKPNQDRLLKLLALELEPVPGYSNRHHSSAGFSSPDVARLHAFFREQDNASAAEFRALAIKRGWARIDYSDEIAEVLLKDGQRDAAIQWLANVLVQCRFPLPVFGGLYRFPIKRYTPSDYLVDDYLPPRVLELIARQKLALPVLAAMEAIPGGDDPVLRGFLKFYDAPSLESFDRHLGGLTSPTNPHFSNTLLIRTSFLLNKLSHTKALAKEMKEAAMKRGA
jgi:hypothetical protein